MNQNSVPFVQRADRFPGEALKGLLFHMAQALGGSGIEPEMVGMQLIAFVSLLVQGLADVAWPNGQSTPVGANVLLVAPSSGGKSLIFRMLMDPIERAIRDAKAALPVDPAFLIEDSTREAILQQLKGWPVAGLFTAEAGQLKLLLKNAASTLAKLLDGEPLRNARISTGRMELIGRRLTMLLLEQPNIFEASKVLLGASRGGVGLINRFFVGVSSGFPGGASLHTLRLPGDISLAYEQRVNDLIQRSIGQALSEGDRPILQLSVAASQAIVSLSEHCRQSLLNNPGLSSGAEYINRLPERVLRLAGALHVFEHGSSGEVQLDTVQTAEAIGVWSVNAFMAMTDEPIKPTQTQLDAQVMERALLHTVYTTGKTSFPLREVRSSAPNVGMTKQRFDRALPILAGHRRVTVFLLGRAEWLRIETPHLPLLTF